MTGKMVKIGVSLLLAAAVGGVAVHAADSPQTVEKMIQQRRLSQYTSVMERRQKELNIRYSHRIDGGGDEVVQDNNASIVNDNGMSVSPMLGAAGARTSSVGVSMAETSYDYQHNESSGWQTGRFPANSDIVHFIYMEWPIIPADVNDNSRFVYADWYSISGGNFTQPFNGAQISLDNVSRGGYPDLAIGKYNNFHGSFHQRPDPSLPYTSWHAWAPTPGSGLHIDDEMATNSVFQEVLWPQIAVNQKDGWDSTTGGKIPDVAHMISHGGNNDARNRIVYWRYVSGSGWVGPVAVDSSFTLGYIVVADAHSDKVAILLNTDREAQFNGNNNVCYYEDGAKGAGFISHASLGDANKHIITNYNDPSGAQAWLHITGGYDSGSRLHVLWDEQRQANVSSDIALRHWQSGDPTKIRPVALGYWATPLNSGAFNLNLSAITMGFGDGGTTCNGSPNTDYLYTVYTRFAGPSAAEQADYSHGGYYNGELYISESNDLGNSWSPPINLTNTKTPNCNPGPGDPQHGGAPPRPDSICLSEHWSTIGQLVHDIDIIFIEDHDAGGIPQSEGFWEMDPVKYLRYPGGVTDGPIICPVISANFAGTVTSKVECEYHAPRGGSNTDTLRVINLGNSAMTGAISKTQVNGPANWLTLSVSGNYNIGVAGADVVSNVLMNAAAIVTEGLYQGTIRVTYQGGALAKDSTDFPINFFVFDQFFCPENEFLKTNVASPGSLSLGVTSNGRFATQGGEGGLWRYKDSSSSIYDASLLIAHGSQSPDTTVFYRFYDRNTRGQFGYRAQSDLVFDTSKYGTHGGFAKASANMSTKDSAVWLKWEWYAPQHADSDEFIICRLCVWDRNATPLTSLVVGLLMDYDVVPAGRLGSVQLGVNNKPGFDASRNLLWQQGVDTANAGATIPNSAARFRGGVAVETSGPLCGGRIGNNTTDNQPQGGPSDEFLYRSLVNLSGIDVYSDRDTDLYMMVKLAQVGSLADTDTLYIVWALVSDTGTAVSTSDAGIKAKADMAAAWAASHGIVSHFPNNTANACGCSCPCHNDPKCDGVTDVLDVVQTIGVAFRGATSITDPGCPKQQCDMDCNGVVDVLDVVKIIGVAFRGALPTTLCNACG
ncbi:MAG: hypothetical protein HY304_04325 [candidate division Zixibacteria bacterium]|nr:hypothetical protein [candidate division Zixibacteria bacterium]